MWCEKLSSGVTWRRTSYYRRVCGAWSQDQVPVVAELHNSLYCACSQDQVSSGAELPTKYVSYVCGARSQVQVSPGAEIRTTGVYVVREAKIRCHLSQIFINSLYGEWIQDQVPSGAELPTTYFSYVCGARSQVQVSSGAELHTTVVYVVHESKIRCHLAQNFILRTSFYGAWSQDQMTSGAELHTSVVYVVREAKFRCHPAQNFILQLCMWCVKPTSCAIWPKLFVLHSSDTYVLCNSKTWCYLEQTRCFELQKFYWSNTSYISCHVIDSLKRWRRPIGCSNIWHKSGASEVNTRNSLSNRCSQP